MNNTIKMILKIIGYAIACILAGGAGGAGMAALS